ncbi:N-acetyltransferase [Paenibacillus macerans]|nr:N-acetyltransferase [Paenibacillus macerans]
MNIRTDVSVNEVTNEQIPAAIDFMAGIRREVFPMLQNDPLPKDMLHFEQVYLEPEDASFFVAAAEDGRIIGTIGVLRYNERIEAIRGRYNQESVAEIVRCFVGPATRRRGVGSLLFREAANFAKDAGYSMLYLHTHHFLNGAVAFWQRQGFQSSWTNGTIGKRFIWKGASRFYS